MKELLKWVAAGLGGILAAALAQFTSGAPVSLKSVGAFIGAAVLVRAAQWVVANLGPKPAA